MQKHHWLHSKLPLSGTRQEFGSQEVNSVVGGQRKMRDPPLSLQDLAHLLSIQEKGFFCKLIAVSNQYSSKQPGQTGQSFLSRKMHVFL